MTERNQQAHSLDLAIVDESEVDFVETVGAGMCCTGLCTTACASCASCSCSCVIENP